MKILVIADVHGNADALAAVLDKENDADRTVFLGDAAFPGPQANETIALLQGMPGGTHIAGNHDTEMLEPERFAGYPKTWLALYEWVLDNFDPEGYELVRALKPAGEYVEDGITMCLRHGVLPGKVRNALPDSPDESLMLLADGSKSDYVLFGHSHVQFSRVIDGQHFINPGSVGQNRCGSQLACYGVFEDGVFRHCQVAYDQTPWLRAMDRVSTLDEFSDFRDWLKTGLTTGYGIGKGEPWTRLAEQGYI